MNKKIISIISSHTPKPEILNLIISELNKISKTILFAGEQVYTNASETILHNKTTGYAFPYITRKWIYDNIDGDWDYILYNEDDIFISESVIKNVLDIYESVPKPYVPGFIRYEHDERDNSNRYIDMHPAHSVHRNGPTDRFSAKTIFDTNLGLFWEPWNIHSGCWVFSKEDIKTLIENKYLETSYREHGIIYYTELESVASIPYLYFTKIFPENFEAVAVQHVPSKYIFFDPNNPTQEQIKTYLKNA
jgi:hypothetical protein